MTGTDVEGQRVSAISSLLLMIPFILFIPVVRSPHSTLSVVLSLIPFFSPVLMFVRIWTSPPSFFQIACSIVLLILTIILTIWLSAKVYRTGILMHGKRVSLSEILRWLGKS